MKGLSRPAAIVLAIAVAAALVAAVFDVLGLGTDTPSDDFGLTGFGGFVFIGASLAFTVPGVLIVSRVPGNRIGGVLILIGLLLGVGILAYEYADYALYISPGALPGVDGAASLQNVVLTPCIALLGLALLLFPDGKLPSPRWRWAARVCVLGSVLLAVGYALRSGPLDPPFDQVVNPTGAGSFELMDALSGVGWLLSAAGVVLAAIAMVIRLRRSRGEERQQFKWLALVGVALGTVFLVNFLTFILGIGGLNHARDAILGIALASFPAAIGMAILRYRLYDIDVVINRTVVYLALTITLAALYVGTVLLAQLILSGLTASSNLAIAASTLAVAAAFRPARARIQELVDRRFYRRKYDAARTLEGFAARLRDEVDLRALDAELRGVVA